MKKELFINHIRHRGVTIIPRNDPNFSVCLLDDFRRIKGFFQYIDFNCQINATGGCKETPKALKCCCYDCYGSGGYFRRMLDTDITKYARHFSVKTGFWRKGKGCILTHKMRSVTCLGYHCNRGEKGGEDFIEGIMYLKYRLHELKDTQFNINCNHQRRYTDGEKNKV